MHFHAAIKKNVCHLKLDFNLFLVFQQAANHIVMSFVHRIYSQMRKANSVFTV